MKTSEAELNTQLSVEETTKQNSNSRERLEKIEIERTPFTVIRQDDEWHVVMGKYRLSERPFKSKEEALEDASREDWFRLMQVIAILIEVELKANKN